MTVSYLNFLYLVPPAVYLTYCFLFWETIGKINGGSFFPLSFIKGENKTVGEGRNILPSLKI